MGGQHATTSTVAKAQGKATMQTASLIEDSQLLSFCQSPKQKVSTQPADKGECTAHNVGERERERSVPSTRPGQQTGFEKVFQWSVQTSHKRLHKRVETFETWTKRVLVESCQKSVKNLMKNDWPVKSSQKCFQNSFEK